MYIPITLRAKSGRRVKTFHITGAQHLDEVVEFIWREMFLSMLASGGGGHGDRIPGMLQDIERISGWRGVQRILYGGKRSLFDLGYDCETESEDYPDDEVVDDDDDDDFEDEGSDDEFDEPHHCRHWSSRVSNQMPQLQRLIESALIAVFEDTPSTSLYTALLSMSADTASTEERLLGLLKSIATVCSDTYAVALEIYAKQRKTDLILNLLDSHSHLLRSRDAHALQSAVLALSHRGHVQRATQILEAELLETSNAVRQSLLLSYSQLDDEHNRTEISSIIKLRSGAGDRRDRVETWVDNITTPGAETPNPLLFAAMMMGMPPMPGMSQDDDPYTYLDFDPLDPDLEDLRCEFRPGLKQRFESWVDIGLTLRTGPAVLLKVYKDIIDVMPFLRAPDATEEMINRLQDRVSKKYVCEGLDALLAFVKVQRHSPSTSAIPSFFDSFFRNSPSASSTPPLPAPASPPPATALSAFGFLFPGTQSEAGISGPTGGGVEDVD
ncbi:hypothetical protein EW026_g614 [Hermanssonia centrifuga]|uniref:Uncharacterized protein n=1 Tax=Hermanssonia centrifuga TaxID=98765 RepID=A0A4S4KU26_9APHY|nr:hypothetical protein EW026_g614 [Hermanssonia centrifuga]